VKDDRLTIQEQFRLVAKLFTSIEEVAVRGPLPVSAIKAFLDAAGVNESGRHLVGAMLTQSERIKLSDDRKFLVPRHEQVTAQREPVIRRLPGGIIDVG
jgi:hypothetical protein